jgi:hypothetical protein
MLSSTVIGKAIHPRSKLAGYSTGNNRGIRPLLVIILIIETTEPRY